MRLGLAATGLALGACLRVREGTPAPAPGPPVTLTQATLPVYTLASRPSIRVEVHAPTETAYRASAVGSKPVSVEVEIGNAGAEPLNLAGAAITFRVRRGAVRIPCAARNDVPTRELDVLPPGQKTTLVRELCSLPLPGRYDIETLLALPGSRPERVGSFPFVVRGEGPSVPRAVEGTPGLYAALGGNVQGVRYTQPEWQSGAYQVILRLTNASPSPINVPSARVIFRVTKEGRPLACTETYDLKHSGVLSPGETWDEPVPVNCLIDVLGKYDIQASLAMSGQETSLAVLGVEVTSNPLLYLPVHPW